MTIAGELEKLLTSKGIPAEVLDFSVYGHGLLHSSAMAQSYVHQYHPDVVVLVTDLLSPHYQWPSHVPSKAESDQVKRLGWLEGRFKKLTQYSAFLTAIDEQWQSGPKFRRVDSKTGAPQAGASTVRTTEVNSEVTIQKSKKDLSLRLKLPLASLAATCSEAGSTLFVTIPFGPYSFSYSDKQMVSFMGKNVINLRANSCNYGTVNRQYASEFHFVEKTIYQAASKYQFKIIDFDRISETLPEQKVRLLTSDGLHYTEQGNLIVAKRIAYVLAQYYARTRKQDQSALKEELSLQGSESKGF